MAVGVHLGYGMAPGRCLAQGRTSCHPRLHPGPRASRETSLQLGDDLVLGAVLGCTHRVVTVALSSSSATVVVPKQVAIVEGVVGTAMLARLQLAVAGASVSSGRVQQTVESQPILVHSRGEFQHGALRR